MTAPTHPAPVPLSRMPEEARPSYRAWSEGKHGLNIMDEEAFAAGWLARDTYAREPNPDTRAHRAGGAEGRVE